MHRAIKFFIAYQSPQLNFSSISSTKLRSAEGLTLETSALKLFTVANLRYQLSWSYQITLSHKAAN